MSRCACSSAAKASARRALISLASLTVRSPPVRSMRNSASTNGPLRRG